VQGELLIMRPLGCKTIPDNIVWAKNSSSLGVSEKLEYFNADELMEGPDLCRLKNTLPGGRMSFVTIRHRLSFIPLLRYIEETYRVGLGDEKSNYQSP